MQPNVTPENHRSIQKTFTETLCLCIMIFTLIPKKKTASTLAFKPTEILNYYKSFTLEEQGIVVR